MSKELEEAAESRYGTDMGSIRGSNLYDLNTDLKKGFIAGAKWQIERSYSEEELRNAMNWMLTQYFEFHEWPAMGRVDHYVQSIKSE